MKTTDMKSFKQIVRKTLKEFTVDKDGKFVDFNKKTYAEVAAKHGFTEHHNGGFYSMKKGSHTIPVEGDD